MVERNLGQNMIYWIGEVVDVNDPHQSGRVKIRVYGHHDDRTNIPDSALPWAQVTQSPTSAAIGRIGSAPVGLVVGSRVIGFWADSSDLQYPLVIGTIGKAGDPIDGQMLNGAPAIDTNTGSIPQSSSGNPNNPYTSLNQDRVSISNIDSGSASITSVSGDTGGAVTSLVERLMANPTLPTVASYNKNSTDDVLDINKAVDPLGTLSSLPCLNNNLISISSILSFLGSTVAGIVSGIVNTVVQAIRNAILKLAQKIGLFKLLGMLNAAVSKVKAVQDLMNTLNVKICGINIINQGLFDTANFAMASVIGGLNSTVGAITGGINNVINTATGAVTAAGNAVTGATNSAINSLLNSVPTAPLAAIATALSPRPLSTNITQTPPTSYIQQYYTIANDPYPGYIEWVDPTGAASPVYTPRNGEPNYANAKEHTSFAAQNQFTSTIGNTLLSGNPLSFDTLVKAVSGSINFTQAFGLSKVLGAGFGTAQTIGVVAALIPTVVSGVTSAFQPNNSQARYTGGSTTQPVNNFMQAQAMLARQSALMRAGLSIV
jgi:Gp5 N-terminal OB domain